MDKLNLLDLLTLIVGVSVYVATIRLVVIARLIEGSDLTNKKKYSYQKFLLALIPADLPLLVAAVSLCIYLFSERMFGHRAPGWLVNLAIWCFMIAVGVLVFHHVLAWIKNVSNLLKLYCKLSKDSERPQNEVTNASSATTPITPTTE